jgi:hypothetical protein
LGKLSLRVQVRTPAPPLASGVENDRIDALVAGDGREILSP